ncbi:MAG: hypothetical protein HYV32_04350 [Candidatus Kerfeldbacteria bacterium]|nr:hypothetical protein [Candidatus Kerfeldbacteria bacterium]
MLNKFFIQKFLPLFLGVLGVTSIVHGAHAATINIDSSLALSSTDYRMIHHEIDGQDYLFVAGGEDGVLIYAIADSGVSSSPTSTINTAGTAVDIAANGDYLYIADSSAGSGFNTRGHMFIYNIANPASPQLTYDYSVSFTSIQSVEVNNAGTTAYVGDRLYGVHVLDVGDHSNPTELSVYEDGLSAIDMTIDGNTLYILQSFSEGATGYVYVLDVSSPSSPAALGGGSISYTANELVVQNNVLYVAAGAEGFQAYDYTNPSNPTLTASYDTTGSTNALTFLSDNVAIIADGSGGVDVLSVAQGSATLLTESTQTELNTAVDAVTVGDRIFILANGIYEISLSYSFDVSGSANGDSETITVTESGNDWCTITVNDGTLGAQAFLADMNGDGVMHEIVTAPVGKTKQPRMRLYDVESCAQLSSVKLSDSDKKQQYTLGVQNYYTTNEASEIIAARVFEKDDTYQLSLAAYFVKTDNTFSKKASITENPTQKKFYTEGFKIKFNTEKSYPIIIQAKNSSDIKVKYQLKKKNDGSFTLKKKTA